MNIGDRSKGIFGVVVAVNNLDEAIKNYQRLDFELVDRSSRETWGLEAAQFKTGENSMIELVSPVAEDKEVAQIVRKFLDKNGEGVYMVAVNVADIDAVCKSLKEKGVRIAAEPQIVPGFPKQKQMWVSPRSTNGVFLEFIT